MGLVIVDMAKNSVAIVVLNWNKKDDTLECLNSVRNLRSKQIFDIFLVDNGSTDGSVSFLKANFPRIYYIENPINLGYAGGNNVGIKEVIKSKYSFILILNNDLIVDTNMLTELLTVMKLSDKVGVVGAVNYYYSERKRIQFSGGCIDWYRGNIYDTTRHLEDKGQFPEYRQVETITGSCMLIRREVFEQVGLFDERFFLNFEETDFCCRARKAGYNVFTCMKARLWHKVSLSFKIMDTNILADYFQTRNKFLFLWKNSPKRYLIFSIPYHIFDTFMKVFKYAVNGRHQNMFSLLVGTRDGLLGRYYEGSLSNLLNR